MLHYFTIHPVTNILRYTRHQTWAPLPRAEETTPDQSRPLPHREDPRTAAEPQRLGAPSKQLAPKRRKGGAHEASTLILPKFASKWVHLSPEAGSVPAKQSRFQKEVNP